MPSWNVVARRKEVPYIGHLLTPDGLRPDPNKVKAIVEMPTPVDKQSLQRVLGMITYLGKFLPHLSGVTEPLRRLLDRDVAWHREDTQESAVNQVKQITRYFDTDTGTLTNTDTVTDFDKTKEITLQCDASDSGLSAVIMQEGQPVAFSSRALTNTEKNYAQIEKELLSFDHGCTRFDQYVYGREITIQTDRKPLVNNLKKPLLQAPKRLQRMLL